MHWCYPRLTGKLERWRWTKVARAAHRFGVNVRRGWWAPTSELKRLICATMDTVRTRMARSLKKRRKVGDFARCRDR